MLQIFQLICLCQKGKAKHSHGQAQYAGGTHLLVSSCSSSALQDLVLSPKWQMVSFLGATPHVYMDGKKSIYYMANSDFILVGGKISVKK